VNGIQDVFCVVEFKNVLAFDVFRQNAAADI
jgi:hypothetical protein